MRWEETVIYGTFAWLYSACALDKWERASTQKSAFASLAEKLFDRTNIAIAFISPEKNTGGQGKSHEF